MADGSGSGLFALIAAKLVCYGGLVLVATGAMSGAVARVRDGSLMWVAAQTSRGRGQAVLPGRIGGHHGR